MEEHASLLMDGATMAMVGWFLRRQIMRIDTLERALHRVVERVSILESHPFIKR